MDQCLYGVLVSLYHPNISNEDSTSISLKAIGCGFSMGNDTFNTIHVYIPCKNLHTQTQNHHTIYQHSNSGIQKLSRPMWPTEHQHGWGETTRILVPWRQGFRHLTRSKCMGCFAQIHQYLAHNHNNIVRSTTLYGIFYHSGWMWRIYCKIL